MNARASEWWWFDSAEKALFHWNWPAVCGGRCAATSTAVCVCAPFALKAKRNVNQLQIMIVVVCRSRHDQYTGARRRHDESQSFLSDGEMHSRSPPHTVHKVESDTEIVLWTAAAIESILCE